MLSNKNTKLPNAKTIETLLSDNFLQKIFSFIPPELLLPLIRVNKRWKKQIKKRLNQMGNEAFSTNLTEDLTEEAKEEAQNLSYFTDPLLKEIFRFIPKNLLHTTLVSKKFNRVADQVFLDNLTPEQKSLRRDEPTLPMGKLSAKLIFFGVNQDNQHLFKFLSERNGYRFLTKEDRALVKAITDKEDFNHLSLLLWKKSSEQGTLFSYLHKNRFILCREFVEIPIVTAYLKKIAANDNLSFYAGYLLSDPYLLNEKGNKIRRALNLETLLLCCLLSEVIEATEGEEKCKQFIFSNFHFAKSSHVDFRNNKFVTSPKDLYAICRAFLSLNRTDLIEQRERQRWDRSANLKHCEIDNELISRFYDSYIEYLKRDKDVDTTLIKQLTFEKLEYLQCIAGEKTGVNKPR